MADIFDLLRQVSAPPAGPVSWLVVGLGNPGEQYSGTRHNAGFAALDALAEKAGCTVNRARFSALTGEAAVGGVRALLMKPQTYMNLSGLAVKELSAKYNVPSDEIVVISDDIDLSLGSLRIRKSGSAGTHNGLKNIIAELASKDFIRFRVGVGANENPNMDLKDYVLSHFSKDELAALSDTFDNVASGIYELLKGETIDIVMGRYNVKKPKE